MCVCLCVCVLVLQLYECTLNSKGTRVRMHKLPVDSLAREGHTAVRQIGTNSMLVFGGKSYVVEQCCMSDREPTIMRRLGL